MTASSTNRTIKRLNFSSQFYYFTSIISVSKVNVIRPCRQLKNIYLKIVISFGIWFSHVDARCRTTWREGGGTMKKNERNLAGGKCFIFLSLSSPSPPLSHSFSSITPSTHFLYHSPILHSLVPSFLRQSSLVLEQSRRGMHA